MSMSRICIYTYTVCVVVTMSHPAGRRPLPNLIPGPPGGVGGGADKVGQYQGTVPPRTGRAPPPLPRRPPPRRVETPPWWGTDGRADRCPRRPPPTVELARGGLARCAIAVGGPTLGGGSHPHAPPPFVDRGWVPRPLPPLPLFPFRAASPPPGAAATPHGPPERAGREGHHPVSPTDVPNHDLVKHMDYRG